MMTRWSPAQVMAASALSRLAVLCLEIYDRNRSKLNLDADRLLDKRIQSLFINEPAKQRQAKRSLLCYAPPSSRRTLDSYVAFERGTFKEIGLLEDLETPEHFG
jgi:hypothetical protein